MKRPAGLLALLAPAVLLAQNTPPAPAEFKSVYSEIAAQLAGSSLTKSWDGTKYPVWFGGEITPASAYTNIIQPGYYRQSVTPFLDAVQLLGAFQVAKINIHFPLLYPPFYTGWSESGGMAAYNARLTFYQNLVADLHRRGIKVIVQTMAQGAGDFASTAADPLNLTGYYKTLSFADYVSGRAAQTLAICRLLAPDYVNFDSEPDEEWAKGQQTALDPGNQQQFLANNLTLVTSIRDAVVNANPPVPGLHSALRLVIGMGSWERYLPSLVSAYTQMAGIDVIDVHVHPINATASGDYLANIATIADAAAAQRKAVGMDETWLYHESGAEIGKIGAPQVEVRDDWSFWAPVDTSFLTLMMNYANARRMEYVSFAWPGVFMSYLDYANTPGCATPPWSVCSVTQWNTAANRALAAAMTTRPLPVTAIGAAFQRLLAGQADVTAATVSAASFTGPEFAPDSIVSIFGGHLATGSAQAGEGTLATSLAGTGATLEDSAGKAFPLQLALVAPGQINAAVPPGVNPGLVTITVRAADGVVSKGTGFVSGVVPGIFTPDGKGSAAAVAVKTAADGSQTSAFTTQCTNSGCTPVPIDLGAAGDSVTLLLFGTGIRGARPEDVAVSIGGVSVPVLYAGPQSEYPGLDQVNVTLPRSLAGSGRVDVKLTSASRAANTVSIAIR